MFNYLPLLIFFCLVLALGFVLPSYRVWKQTGINPYVLPKDDSAYGYVTLCMKLILISLALYLVYINVYSNSLSFFLEFSLFKKNIFVVFGYCLLIVSLFIMIIAQYQMGQSWRIGIDEKNKALLIANGLFNISRNPIFLSMTVLTIALFFITPNAFTLIIFITSRIVMQFQVRLEEKYLAAEHGDNYDSYCRKVRRWI